MFFSTKNWNNNNKKGVFMAWIFLGILLIYIVFLYRTIAKLKTEVLYAHGETAEVSRDCEEWKKRCSEVEDAMEKGYGIQVRTEVKPAVDTEFTKLEMVILTAGVEKLIKSTKNVPDAEIYIKLFKKINALLDVMEEEEYLPRARG